MRILIAGAGGQLGLALPEALRGHEVTCLTRAELDITSLEAVRVKARKHAPDLLLNAAAYNHVDRAESDVEGAFRGNALGPRNLAIVAEEQGFAVLHVSTDYVFDGTSEAPYHEWSTPRPLSVYGRSKLAGEEAVQLLCRRHYIVRTAWVYSTNGTNFPRTILERARQGEVKVVEDQVGCPTYAPHLAAAIARLVPTGAYGRYHLAGRGATSWFSLTRALFEQMGVTSRLSPVTTAEFPRPARRPPRVVLETLQDPRILLPSWEEGLAEFAAALRAEGKESP
ncbi:MAG TPA: dTDP-4-dehydrorhamnose reductase [Vicinamibacteria bacterium]|nr:dTDP-4-dehydrorhamnose reductase [Vicinamibacteria bacterium]